MPSALRSVVAVVVGFLVIGALAFGTGMLLQLMSPAQFDARGTPTTTVQMLVQLAYVGVFATFGCWLTGRLAPSRPTLHALVVGVLGLALNIPSAIALRDSHPAWYLATGLLTTMLWAWLGGRLAEGRGRRAAVRAAVV
ncbi:MAG TPA: hypothetical protein VEA99_15620 [Gemmatimonadaceae bacterium]|nr:hypothetical protein [Gemmatimonadaceae bacterium]